MASREDSRRTDGSAVHTIQVGDCLYSIARRHKTDVRQLLAANPGLGEKPDKIIVGQEILLPGSNSRLSIPLWKQRPLVDGPLASVCRFAWKPRQSFVKIQVLQGDSLNRIAEMYRTSVEDIKRINNLSSTHICVGQHLYIARPGLFASILRNPRDFMSLNGVGGPDISEQALKGIAQRSNGVVPRKNAPPRSSAVVSRNVRKPKALPLHQTFSSAIGNIIRRNRFSFPLEERIVSSGYGMRWGRLHQGVDFAAETGTHICAAAHGKVSYAGYDGPGYGNLVEVSHSDGFVTRYAHCHDILVQLGQDIVAGETIGTVGETGRASGPHLHFEIRQNDKSIDPLQLLR